MKEFIAHIRESREVQSLQDHSRNVAKLCGEACKSIGVEHVGYLAGLLHDMGKAHEKVQNHLWNQTSEKLNHATAGMRWIWNENKQKKPSYKLMAQIVSMAIGCHHSGLDNFISPKGEEDWEKRLDSETAQQLYEGSVKAFLEQCMSVEEATELMHKAVTEVITLVKGINTEEATLAFFALSMVQRFLFGALVDADWTDTKCYMNGEKLPEPVCDQQRQEVWNRLSESVEQYIAAFPQKYAIDAERTRISNLCLQVAEQNDRGIYRLYVPTGGGKTLAGLRFCMRMAQKQNAQHVFYFSPYKSITTQNSEEIRKAVGEGQYVLEHHSDVIMTDDKEGQEKWLAQMQRWQGVPIICTTMVQFLNTLFYGARQNVRRMPALAGSILLFDEVQALPSRLTHLFCLAIQTLERVFQCTIILCTATQPDLEYLDYPVNSKDIIPDAGELFRKFKRVQVMPHLTGGGYTIGGLADFVGELSRQHSSVLVVVNTKGVAGMLYQALETYVDPEVQRFYLTTNLCYAHRKKVLGAIQEGLAQNQRIICISTQLIEAGVDLSFSCVVRDLAGLPSIIQAAGRCNRHGEAVLGTVHVVACREENLEALPEIRYGARATRDVLQKVKAEDLLSPEAIRLYYQLYYQGDVKAELSYPLSVPYGTGYKRVEMVDLLSCNMEGREALAQNSGREITGWTMCQAFRFAGENFAAIPDETESVLVEYGEGKTKIQALLRGEGALVTLSELQPYTVAVSRGALQTMIREGMVYPVEQGGVVYILRGEFYDKNIGIKKDSQAFTGFFA